MNEQLVFLNVVSSTVQELLVRSGSSSQLEWYSQGTLHLSDSSIKTYQKLLRSGPRILGSGEQGLEGVAAFQHVSLIERKKRKEELIQK